MKLIRDGKELGIGDIVDDGFSSKRGKWRLVLYYGCPALELFDAVDTKGNPKDYTKIYNYLTHPSIFNRFGIKMNKGDRVKRTDDYNDILERI